MEVVAVRKIIKGYLALPLLCLMGTEIYRDPQYLAQFTEYLADAMEIQESKDWCVIPLLSSYPLKASRIQRAGTILWWQYNHETVSVSADPKLSSFDLGGFMMYFNGFTQTRFGIRESFAANQRRPLRGIKIFHPSLLTHLRWMSLCLQKIYPGLQLTEDFKTPEIRFQASLARIELDIFYPALNVAIEYNGRQHYDDVYFFGDNFGYV